MTGFNFKNNISLSVLFLMTIWTALPCGTANGKVSRKEIDQIRLLNLLNEQHSTKIDAFVKERFDSMLQAEDATDLSDLARDLIETAQSTKRADVRLAYSNRFAGAVKSAYKIVLEQADNHPDKSLAEQIKLQAVVVVAHTDNVSMIEDLLGLLGNETVEIRYWAIKGLSMPVIQDYLGARDNEDNQEDVKKVNSALAGALTEESSPMIIAEIATAVITNGGEWVKILQDCVAKRIAQYKSWAVDNESADEQILQKIFGIVERRLRQGGAVGREERELVGSAAQLYAAAFERYTKGMRYATEGKVIAIVPEASRSQLLTLLIESEKRFLRISNSIRSASFIPDVRKQKWIRLYKSFDRLLGPRGDVQRVFEIYPQDGGENSKLVELPEPPMALVKQAQVLDEIKDKIIGADK